MAGNIGANPVIIGDKSTVLYIQHLISVLVRIPLCMCYPQYLYKDMVQSTYIVWAAILNVWTCPMIRPFQINCHNFKCIYLKIRTFIIIQWQPWWCCLGYWSFLCGLDSYHYGCHCMCLNLNLTMLCCLEEDLAPAL